MQVVSEPLRPRGQAHAQEVPVDKPDLDRAVPGAEQVQAHPPSIAARGCGGREEPADSEDGQAARQAEEEPSVQPCEDEPRRACGGEEEAYDIRDVGASEVAGTQKKSRERGSGADDGGEPGHWL